MNNTEKYFEECFLPSAKKWLENNAYTIDVNMGIRLFNLLNNTDRDYDKLSNEVRVLLDKTSDYYSDSAFMPSGLYYLLSNYLTITAKIILENENN